jgi:hypothetical protein
MNAIPDSLQTLAARARQGDAAARQEFSRELEAGLVPLVRCALRRGTGLPALVSWVRKNADRLPAAEPLDTAQAAPRIARLLCAGLVQQFEARGPVRETVCET